MTQDRIATLFFEMFTGLPRQGPGDATSTLRALSLVPEVGAQTRVLIPGCGTGLEARLIAHHAPVRILAIDNHPPFVEEFNRQAHALGLADRVEARVGDMHRLEFPSGSFDLVWCEGAIYVVGFTGLREWRHLLAPGGHIALTEVCWTKPDPPPECMAFWTQEYPAIRDVPRGSASSRSAVTSRWRISRCPHRRGGMTTTVRCNRRFWSFVTVTMGRQTRSSSLTQCSVRSTCGSGPPTFTRTSSS